MVIYNECTIIMCHIMYVHILYLHSFIFKRVKSKEMKIHIKCLN